MFARTSLVVLLAGLAAAQTTPSISTQCTTALASILANSNAASCLSLGDVIPVLTLSSNTSLIPSITTWLGDMCVAQACSNSTLDSVTSSVIQGCQNDLITNGVLPQGTTISVSQAQQDVEIAYTPAREVVCSKSIGNWCLINTLTSIQTLIGAPLSEATLFSADWTQLASTLDTSSLCTDCNQAAYATLRTPLNLQGTPIETVISNRCGSTFVSGSVPADVTLGGVTTTHSGAEAVRAALAGLLGTAGIAALLF
ncbi:hypothetical protein DACRYDRAFT_21309 [Dacryopinax primogenitus]|uniref:Uncharacterized protein n=1 Tax=Dacryopinax primogenitus (strain DJM 731) TaxID=1858805 RepID=M5G0Y5_DACPD|nr:uncharacterized protein DACRYDRAFT_21309 [Dacryopinax primogenitus]EJU03911.1 hypothetical protein DACRYDRAFT_21309 [Dacryopinax primogenitus]